MYFSSSHVARILFLAALCLLSDLLPGPLTGQVSSSETPTDRILAEVSRSPSLEENLRTLCDEIGGRLPGTPSMRRAVEWSVEAFRKAGADSVHTESFEIPNSWQEGETHIEVLSPVRFAVRGVSSAWVPATPRGGIRAEVLNGGSGSRGYIRRLGPKAKGKTTATMMAFTIRPVSAPILEDRPPIQIRPQHLGDGHVSVRLLVRFQKTDHGSRQSHA